MIYYTTLHSEANPQQRNDTVIVALHSQCGSSTGISELSHERRQIVTTIIGLQFNSKYCIVYDNRNASVVMCDTIFHNVQLLNFCS